jgi:hypothetical protein
VGRIYVGVLMIVALLMVLAAIVAATYVVLKVPLLGAFALAGVVIFTIVQSLDGRTPWPWHFAAGVSLAILALAVLSLVVLGLPWWTMWIAGTAYFAMFVLLASAAFSRRHDWDD